MSSLAAAALIAIWTGAIYALLPLPATFATFIVAYLLGCVAAFSSIALFYWFGEQH